MPTPIKAVSTLSRDYSFALSFPSYEVSHIPCSIWLCEFAFSVFHVVLPLSIIDLAIWLFENSFSMSETFFEVPIVSASVYLDVKASAVLHILPVLSIVLRAIWLSEESFSISLIIFPCSNVLGSV